MHTLPELQQAPRDSVGDTSRESISRDGSVEQNATSQQTIAPPVADSAETRERLDGVLHSDVSWTWNSQDYADANSEPRLVSRPY